MAIITDSHQGQIFDVRQFRHDPYPRGSIYDVLERYGSLIIKREDFPEDNHDLGGGEGWCPILKTKLVLLQARHGWKDRETIERATNDLRVKACLGLGVEADGPSQPTLSRHRALMRNLGLAEVYNERFTGLIVALGLIDKTDPVAVDTVPITGAGQVLDVFNLLASSIRKAICVLSQKRGKSSGDVAKEMGLDAYMGRSIKGTANIDWNDPEQRRQFLARLVADARTLQAELAQPVPATPAASSSTVPTDNEADSQGSLWDSKSTPQDDEDPEDPLGGSQATADTQEQLDEAVGAVSNQLEKIIEHEVEFTDDGEVKGVRQKPAGDRLISATDTDMRHGRKSASSLIAGYKTQIVAAVLHGWILFTKVIAANRHDGRDLPEMTEALEARGFQPSAWIGDHAYGLLDNHKYFIARDDDGVGELIARNARPANGGRFTKDEFEIDFAQRTLTCPMRRVCPMTRCETRNGQKGWRFDFGDRCAGCPKYDGCVNPKAAKGKGRSVFVHPDTEQVIRDHLERRQETDFLKLLQHRHVVERANAGFAQCGGKVARRFGLEKVEFDTALTALAHNLRTLGAVTARREDVRDKLEELRSRQRAAPFFVPETVRNPVDCPEFRPAIALIAALAYARQFSRHHFAAIGLF